MIHQKNPILAQLTPSEKERLAKAPKMIIAGAVVVLNEKQEILLVKSPWRGWEIPGGQVEAYEAIDKAAIREVKEESGIDVTISHFCGTFQNVGKGICNMLFVGKPIGGQLTTSPESTEVGWFTIEKALQMVTFKNYAERIRLCLDKSQQPFFITYDVF